MKKLLAFTLCFVMVLSCSISAFAAELPYNEATGQSTVTYQVDSSFCVIIPETVDAFNGFQLTASNMNITESEQVNVSVNGENSIPIRRLVCEELSCLGVKIDLDKNNKRGEVVKISTDDSKIAVYVIPTDEELMIARDTLSIINR